MKSVFRILAVAALAFSSSAYAGDGKEEAPAGEKPKAAAESPAPAKAAPALIAVVDPVTGELRAPTAAERAELARIAGKKALSRAVSEPIVEIRPDGGKRVRVGPEAFRYSVATVEPDGTLRTDCVPATRKELAPPAAPAAPEK